MSVTDVFQQLTTRPEAAPKNLQEFSDNDKINNCQLHEDQDIIRVNGDVL
jgi:hypothetical protein